MRNNKKNPKEQIKKLKRQHKITKLKSETKYSQN